MYKDTIYPLENPKNSYNTNIVQVNINNTWFLYKLVINYLIMKY